LLKYCIAEFLTENFRALLQNDENLNWQDKAGNLLHLTSNLICDSDLFRNEFIRRGIINIAISLHFRSSTEEEHDLVCWLIDNLVNAPNHQESS